MEESQEPVLNKILKVSLVALIVIFVGLGGLVLFSLNKKTSLSGTPNISPSSAVKKITTITPAIVEADPNDINIGSVEADLKDIGTDVESLQ